MNSNLTETNEIRKFGVIGCIFFGSLFAIAVWRDKAWAIYFFGLLAVLSVGFILLPAQLKPVYAGWLKIAHFIGSRVTIVILSIMFYFVITPAGLIKRIFGGRPLPLKPDRNASTYWVIRPEPAQPRERFSKRF
jgi:hypothetical protein